MTRFLRTRPGTLPYGDPAMLLATWGGAGLLRGPSGTWGSLAGLPIGWAILSTTGIPGLVCAILLVTGLGLWATQRILAHGAPKDPSAIVVDEVAGLWVALVPTGGSPWLIVLAFALFRVLDIAKPFPVSWADKRVPGAAGVMLDDLIAGALAAVVVGAWGLVG